MEHLFGGPGGRVRCFVNEVVSAGGLGEADLDVGALFEMDGVDEADLSFVESENHGRCADAVAEETDAFQKIAVGDTGACEDDFFPGGEVFGIVDALRVGDAHFFEALLMLGLADDETRENLAVEAAQSGGGEDTFGSAARAHNHVDPCADDGSGDAGGEVAIADETDASAGFANVGDEFFVARAIEDNDDEVFDVAVETLGDGAQVVGDGGVKFDGAFAGGADDDFFHIQIGGVQQAAFFTGGEHGHGVRGAGGAQVGAFERVDGDVDDRNENAGSAGVEADFFADVEHGGFVALAFADDDGAVHLDFVHRRAHGLDGDFVSFVAVAEAHGAGGRDRSVFDDAQKIEAETFFHTGRPPIEGLY